MRALLVSVFIAAFVASVSTGYSHKSNYWRRRPTFNLESIGCDRIKRADLCYCCKDPCDDVECLNNGMCVNGICHCRCGFSGADCGVDACDSKLCQNNGTCVLEAVGASCKCPDGFTGDNCEVDLCAAKLCQNNGTCVPEAGGVSCECADGFTGDNCEVDLCAAKPCQNNGICVPEAGNITCNCNDGFTGDFCERSVCEPNPCQNCGTCSRIMGGGFKCSCVDRTSGSTCEVVNNIIASPNYPNNYSGDGFSFYIPTCPAKQIRIVFDEDFVVKRNNEPRCDPGSSLVEEMIFGGNCTDYLDITTDLYRKYYCGGTAPRPIMAPGELVAVGLNTNNNGIGCMGFRASYFYVDL